MSDKAMQTADLKPGWDRQPGNGPAMQTADLKPGWDKQPGDGRPMMAYAVQYLDESGRAVEDPLPAELDRYLSVSSIYASSLFETLSDVHMGAYMHHQSQQRMAGLYEGVVKFCSPYFNTYRVSVAGLNGEIICSRGMSDSSAGALGVTDGSMIGIGDVVLLHYRPDTFHGIILCVVPTRCTDGNALFGDYVSQGSNGGMHKDGAHQSYITGTGDEGGAIDFNCHRPVDQLTTDWNRGFITGTMVHVDPFMAMLRSSEMCGVFCLPFEHLRVAGLTMEVWSDGASLESGDHGGETYAYRGEFMYPHEALGAFTSGTETTRDVDPDKVIFDEPNGPLEPAQASQQAFARYEEYGGYEGRGHIRQMQAPPSGASSELFSYGSDAKPVTVIREHFGANGEYSMQFAKSGVWSKRSVIPSIVRKRLRGDQQSDSDLPANYKASGLYGQGPEHSAPELELVGEEKALLAMSALADIHTYKLNWKALCGFRYHKGDYKTYEEIESTALGVNHVMPSYGQLVSRMWLERPSAQQLYVDHVEKGCDVYALMSHFAMLDDGGIVIQAGDGTELRLGNGNLVATAPNLVLVQSGGTTAIVAGDDAVIRARNSADFTAANKDVRIGAGKGLYVGSGLAEKTVGGMLFEDRSYGLEQDYPAKGGEKVKATGITFKSKDSGFAVLSREIYLRTCGPVLQDGNIVLDCNDGKGDIVTASRNFRRFVKNSCTDIFGFEKAAKVNDFNRSRALFCAQVWADGSLRTDGALLVRRDVVSLSGSYYNNIGGIVNKYRDAAQYEESLREVTSTEEQQITEGTETYKTKIKEPYKEDKKIGNEEMLKKVSFGMRTEEDCATQGFLLPQTCWQVYADNGASGMEVWKEEPVKYQESEETVAWPAKEAWNERATLLTLPASAFGFFDLSTGLAKSTEGGAYENPKTGPYERKTPKSAYKVLAKGE